MASQPAEGSGLTFEQKKLNRLSFFDGKGELLKVVVIDDKFLISPPA